MDLVTYWHLQQIQGAKFWDAWHIRNEYRRRMKVLRRITGGQDPVWEGWLLFVGLDYCPHYEQETFCNG